MLAQLVQVPCKLQQGAALCFEDCAIWHTVGQRAPERAMLLPAELVTGIAPGAIFDFSI